MLEQLFEQLFSQIDGNYLLKYSVKFVFAIIIAFFVIKIAEFISKKIESKFVSENSLYYEWNTEKVWKMLQKAFHIIFSIFWVQIALSALWITFWPISSWLAVGIWFLLWDFIENFIAGIFIIFNKHYKMWKFVTIQIEPNKTIAGKIVDINRRYTTLRAIDKTVSIVPNSYFLKYPIKMMDGKVRVQIAISVKHDCDIDDLTKRLIDNINKLEYVKDKDKTAVLLDSITSTWLNLFIWTFFTIWKVSIIKARHEISLIVFNTLKQLDQHHQFNENSITFDNKDNVLLSSWVFLMDKYKEIQKKSIKN